ncbi:AAA domain protein [Yasminevirus sp. GU-2018]|uniref:AAA domain protein n=1 Tax=Yasminevirus sp. GU-2018 TaxID=2420051 RepID=A0A5K0UBF2_9VIRU|nr:AAA domain protein [Yasminevirus sp. GU-2018]
MSDQKSEKGHQTYIINLIGGPGCGKSVLAAKLFIELKLRNYSVEYVAEYAKMLTWTKDFESLNNQYMLTKKQFDLFKKIDGAVDFIITDGPLVHGLYYNRHNRDNTSNIDKTEDFILKCHSEFRNINIFLKRGEFAYEKAGRIQTEEQAQEIDVVLKHVLKQNSVPFTVFESDIHKSEKIVDHVMKICGLERTK